MAKTLRQVPPPEPVPGSPAVQLLQRAVEINQLHESDRDLENNERAMRRTVAAFNALTGYDLTERDGNIFMTLVKMGRDQQRVMLGLPVNPDDFIDGANYLAFAGEARL